MTYIKAVAKLLAYTYDSTSPLLPYLGVIVLDIFVRFSYGIIVNWYFEPMTLQQTR